ncbi:PD-(D/E)XK nuclease family protein [Flavobacterium sp.]|uniref:PDDEXK-like family protein n=1 Tax=Flavobacterium sp. TaxID=239 RepID=UPI002636C3D6|nr:PD-(D/E)XK nuclease family protein [Flavobacterium sp.]
MIKKIDLKQCEQMLTDTCKLIRHQQEKEKLRGEKFNIFSILKMEHRENDTHSAFIAELLNPKGTHLCGTLFLELFLKSITDEQKEENFNKIHKLDIPSTKVKTEHYIGPRNDKDKTGGRIDIYLWDKNNNCISIENKIYAVDQYAQIERYYKHNEGKNTVYYLTLWGNKPSINSCGSLSESDYHIISYKKHIIEWLTLCMKETYDYPTLRESIKQYTLLIKKLTHTMNNEEENELFSLILKNYDEAVYLAENVNKALSKFKGRLRETVFKKLQEKLGNDYLIYKGSNIESSYSQIWIKLKGKEEQKLFFGIQSFAVNKDNYFGQLFVGIFIFNGDYKDEYIELGRKRSNWWLEDYLFEDFKGYKVDLCDSDTLKKLSLDNDFYKDFTDYIVTKSINYINSHHDKLATFLINN